MLYATVSSDPRNHSARHEDETFAWLLQGGVKVLITGPWLESSSEYSCLFDHISVPAALIQPGVLRCYCPGTAPEH